MEREKRSKRTPKRKTFPDDDYVIPKKFLNHTKTNKKTVNNEENDSKQNNNKEIINNHNEIKNDLKETKKKAVTPVAKTPVSKASATKRNSTQNHSKANGSQGSSKSTGGNRKCQKLSCPNTKIECFARACQRCAISGHSARWYHVSDAEHFCNNCFDAYYRSHKEGSAKYEKFKTHWASNCRKEATVKVFFAECFLPYWAQCNNCEKWRKLNHDLELTPEYHAGFYCSLIKGMQCSKAEADYVKEAKNVLWLSSIISRPYLKDSPATPFLKDFYYDCIGLSPPDNVSEDQGAKFWENMIPFYRPDDSEKARCICADVMTLEEKQHFSQHVKDPSMYLALRNLIMAMWCVNPKQYLSYKTCLNQLICRGLGRITLAEELKNILDFLTLNGIINFGILPRVPRPFNLPYWKGKVLVLGAGISGVGAARQLQNAGCEVTVLEASQRCGGRIKDDNTLGNCIGLGAQIITGCINNPVFIMCEQASVALRYLGMRCDLIDDKGSIVENSIDQDMEFRFNLMLDSLEDWKQSANKNKHEKLSLSDALKDQFSNLQKSLCKDVTEIEENLLQFHLGNLEYGCGSSLDKVSAVHWNQNEEFPQYSGAHAWAVDGFEIVVQQLSEGLSIQYNSKVTSINFKGNNVKVKTQSGKTFTADKVVCALPLTIYKSNVLKFDPELPPEKLKAIDRLGAGLIEKLALKFPKAFWKKKIGEADYFGHVPSSEKDRGLFSVFYDVSKGSNHVLMTVIAGEGVKKKSEMSEQQLIDECLKTLQNIFETEKIPQPTAYVVSNWADDENIRMAYSFVKVGSSGSDLDLLAEPIDDKIFFAGEVTHRQFPQTVTGAYLSGLREAKNILLSES